ncbi:glycerophosphodiester phosphodiesterase family protein [Flagellimonas sp. 389]|uniref:glycerophosphodiester phosphodiesterase family protein n=1 Tax=Flagellimonas sp. 389 TaxID=2835862 RepID=UPI001BD44CE2|nr:glycerophosphodiester phosphodiesterase family protein [Flagellimonas sp. 389]MBS9461073.1 glycerophosphodiester phosphodiesterase family protein [Flagellimonas sp. 389]
MKKNIIRLCILSIMVCFSCKKEENTKDVSLENEGVQPETTKQTISIDTLIANLKDSKDNQVIIVAHRGDWRNAPENSLQAIENCIKMGVDMVEIDIRETKDGQLVLMHDETIDRTTTGTGKVSEVTWEYLQTLQLRDGIGHETPHKIPTLEETLLLSKDKILVNLDKSYPIFDKCFEVIEKTGTQAQVVIKGAIPYEQVKEEFGAYLDKVFFMPIVRLQKPNAKGIVDKYLDSLRPVAFEFTVPQDTIKMIDYFDDIRKKGASVWVNSLWPPHNGGHDDEKAALNPSVYDWFIKNNIDIIQTDRPQLLLDYLRSKGLHR